MCWSFGASGVFALLGFVIAYYLYTKKEDKALWIPLAYFGVMELIQALTYGVLGQCNVPANQVLTVLGYMHVAFQPLFINMFAMYFIPAKTRKKIQGYVYALCFIGAWMLILKLVPFPWAGSCIPGETAFCGENFCSKAGEWHLAWYIPLNGIDHLGTIGYTFMSFVLPVLYGSWRMILFHAITGPGFAYLLTTNVNEWPAIWCLFSLGIILAAIYPPFRKKLKVKDWFGKKYPW
ncbi:MAG: DUF5765 domain-containing protein [Candidatus Woesearchaeota archaeon]|jgi:hypothetical protein|nr:DUF5765 domain-containing protein [Candidatus Woesearchaeota archaeon]MDP7198038.1 DUF5765 domain-containing protein [Candidatus Woesearchaeota archaeon]MDP7466872.1 DUF5765 domain-containing protein [Candidatus Woesearchaeota archaeon]MDP7647308.1 DUF5765 domain-containing protein [Candidatus Woesearchaeota archaeon]|tara:strand:- start:69 stop:773 length:705 start_codon:yes stop_codon:yes gene_type:complete